MNQPPCELEVLLPVHNEGDSIERVLREFYETVGSWLPMRFIVCEDGSVDDTKAVLARLADELPITLLMSEARKGYSQAVLDGMAQLTAPYLLCIDSDGQCDPADFRRFWEQRHTADVVLGHRVHRADPRWRRFFSRGFYHVYQLFYHVPAHDPSCPYLLAPRAVVERLRPEQGVMKQGFWWEFVARIHRRGYSLSELPVQHRPRLAGTTQVYRLRKLPGIGYKHFVALFDIWNQTRRAA